MASSQTHIQEAESLLAEADAAFTDTSAEREQITLLLARADTHIALAKAQRYLQVTL
jgi:hypothetical protein